MLPKYLPPEYDEKFGNAVSKKAAEGLSPVAAFRFVHDAIERHEDNGAVPVLEALSRAHAEICPAQP